MGEIWIPPQQITVRALALVWRGPELLMIRVDADSGTVRGYRPIGGGVEFMETSGQAIRREIREELGTECELGKFHGYVENLYNFHGHNGHEIMALWDVTLANKNLYELEQVPYAEESLAHDFLVWRNPFKAELPVWPSTMLEILEREAPLD